MTDLSWKATTFIRSLFFSAAIALASAPALANGDDGPPQRIEVAGTTLQKNGYGRRSVMWIDVYEAALYLPQQSRSVAYAADPSTPAAIRIEVLYDEVPDTMPEGWRGAIRPEISARAFRKMRRAYRNLEEGDVLLFAYVPGNGTRITVNGEQVFTDAGHGLMSELLEQWIGTMPVSQELRTALIGPQDDW